MMYRNLTLIFIVLLAVLRAAYIAWGPLDISPDEAHYWEWSRRLDLSYYSKGPAVAYVIALFTKVFGANDFGIRIGAVVFAAAGSWCIYLLGRELFESEKVGFWSALVANVSPLFAAGSILMTTDVMLIFFWAAAILAVHLGLTRRRAGWWYLAGLLIGLGFLSKYTMALIYPCLFLYFLVSRRDRFWLAQPEPYFAAAISLAAATPVILWNILHGQVTIKHTLGQAHVGEGALAIGGLFEFLGSQAGLLTPVIFIGLVYGAWVALTRGFVEKRDELLLAFFASAPLFAFFLLKSLHAKVQGNWAVASFVAAFPASVWAFDRLCSRQHPPARRITKGVAVFGIVLGAAVSFLAYFPWLLEPVKDDIMDGPPYNRVIGWKELGQEVSAIKRQMEGSGEVFLLSDTYQITSEIALYTEGNPAAYNVNTGTRRMNQYDLWPGPDALGGNAIYVKGGDAELDAVVGAAFADCSSKDIIETHWNNRPFKTWTAFRCYGFKGFHAREIRNY